MHGSAPDIAGKGVANPLASVLSIVAYLGALDFRHAFNASTTLLDKLSVEATSDNTYAQNELALEVKTGIRQPAPAGPSKVLAADRPWPLAAQLEIVGDYTTMAGPAHVYTSGGGLHAQVNGRTLDLVPRTDGKVGLDYRWLGLFHLDLGPFGNAGLSRRTLAGREVIVATLGSPQGNREILVGERLKQPRALGAWRQRLGAYRPVKGAFGEPHVANFQLGESQGDLFAEVSWSDNSGDLGSARLWLTPLSDDEAIVAGPLAGMGETVRRVVVDGEERLWFRGYILRRTP